MILNYLKSLRKQVRAFKILGKKQGQFKSILKSSCLDAQDQPLPWYTYPAVEFLKYLDTHDKFIFEYGSGNSSLFWANKSKNVISVENDEKWFKMVLKNKNPNQDIWLIKDKNAYISAIENVNGVVDIIVIDGHYRLECVQKAIAYLRPGGMIILDNSDWYIKAGEFLKKQNFIEIPFSGLGPINDYAWTTSVFINAGAIPLFKYEYSCPKPVGGIQQYAND
jgi:hypothetical protein